MTVMLDQWLLKQWPVLAVARYEGRMADALAIRAADPVPLANGQARKMVNDELRWWSINRPDIYKEPEPMPEPAVNPKELRAVADGKAPLEYLEAAGNADTARVMKHGAEKHGHRNYTVTLCKVLTYVGAVQRHLDAIKLGQNIDPDSGITHWAHIRANADVVMGAISAGMLVDDRAAYATALSDRVHIEGDTDAKGLTSEYNRGIDELADEPTAEHDRDTERCSATHACRIKCPCRGADTDAPAACVRKAEFKLLEASRPQPNPSWTREDDGSRRSLGGRI